MIIPILTITLEFISILAFPAPSKSNLLDCDSPVTFAYRRSRTDQEDNENDFEMVTNKRRRKIDKSNSYEYHDEPLDNNQYIYNRHRRHKHSIIETTYTRPTPNSQQKGRNYELDK